MTAPRPDVRSISLLGSTGSVGTQTVEVVRAAPDRFRIEALCAGGRDLPGFADQVAELRPRAVGVSREGAADELRHLLAERWRTREALPEIIEGRAAPETLATLDVDIVLNAVAGDQGLRSTLAALDAGRTVALANKESLIAGGPLVKARARPGQLVPVDSEHSALAQGLRGGRHEEVRRLIVTASGGPFRGRRRADLADVTPEQALRHPTWAMGPLITMNSSTLVNKGLEVIEAHLLFDVPYDDIEVVVHPQSIVHSMVEFVDGSTLAQASPPDMRLPIALALAWPDRVPDAARPVDWTRAQQWTFEPLDHELFPAVGLAYAAGRAGGCAPAVFNAANEELVEAFLGARCGYLAVTDTLEAVLSDWLGSGHASAGIPGTVEEVETAQQWARRRAHELIAAG